MNPIAITPRVSRPEPELDERGRAAYAPANLALYRLMSQVTQREAAEKLGVEQHTITRWERSRRPIPAAQAEKFMDAIDRVGRYRRRMLAEGEALAAGRPFGKRGPKTKERA